ncbi:MAG: hypothetical protein ACR2HX_22355 [Pyrinomonadaceae bacterium]
MKFNIVLPEGVAPAMAGVYVQEAHRQATARQEAEQAKREADRERREQIAATLEQFKQDVIKREADEAKARGERERERFENQLHEAFIASNPGATESDWSRNRQTIIDETLRERAMGRGPADFEKQRLLASGRYQGL